MQVNDDNENKGDAREGLAQLEQQNPYAGALIHSEEQFLNSIFGRRRKELSHKTLLSLQRSIFNT